MILLLPVDPAYALDYLAVLKVKLDNGLDCKSEIEMVKSFLEMQIGHDLFTKIANSKEFQLMHLANHRVFDAIEKAHQNRINAREVQRINLLRFEAKKKLQARFFPGQVLMEKKSALGPESKCTLHPNHPKPKSARTIPTDPRISMQDQSKLQRTESDLAADHPTV